MTQAILTQILNQLETLELKELQLLNQKIQQYLMDKEEADKQAVFHQSLLDALKKIYNTYMYTVFV